LKFAPPASIPDEFLSPGEPVLRRGQIRSARSRPELYYRPAISSFAQFAFDYQFINHPAYNRDRGPVSIFGLQLHLQY